MLTRSCVRFGWLVLGIGLLTCSCAKEPDEIMGTGDDDASLIVPEAFVGDVVETETKADLSGVVIGTSFPANTTKVFSVVGYKGTAAPTNWSSPYINNIAVNSGTSSALSFATPQYYPVDGQKVYFYAYSPVKGATYTAGSGSTGPKVTWTLDGHTDVMAAQVTTGIAKAATGTQSQPAFAFTHKLMQLKFKVMKDAALTDLGNVTALKVNNAATSLSMALSNGTVTTLSTGSLTAYSSTTGQAVTTTATYLGTDGSPFLTTKTDNLSLTLTCGGETYSVAADLPADAGPGKICEISLNFLNDNLEITNITVDGSSSFTVPRAGGTFTLKATTSVTPSSNITWTAKTATGTVVGRTTSNPSYNTAKIEFDANNSWDARTLYLSWSYIDELDRPYTGTYNLQQSGYTISITLEKHYIEDSKYPGTRTFHITGDYPANTDLMFGGTQSYGVFTASPSLTITFTKNLYKLVVYRPGTSVGAWISVWEQIFDKEPCGSSWEHLYGEICVKNNSWRSWTRCKQECEDIGAQMLPVEWTSADYLVKIKNIYQVDPSRVAGLWLHYWPEAYPYYGKWDGTYGEKDPENELFCACALNIHDPTRL